MKFFIRTFGCQQNVADSERVRGYYERKGYTLTETVDDADVVVINTCMIRDMAEERVYGYIRNLKKTQKKPQKIILTGCIVGVAEREKDGAMKKKLTQRIPDVALVPMETFDFSVTPRRKDNKHAWVVIANGCNNYCAFCIVPFARGKEVSRPFEDIIAEVEQLARDGYTSVTLLGQNVNSYGSDMVLAQKKSAQQSYVLPDGETVQPVMVTHLGRTRIPTLFPYLLDRVARVAGIETVTFTSSNPWDFSDALIDVIAAHDNIDRLLHLPVQSGSDTVLKNMRRWYTARDFRDLIGRIRARVAGVTFATDIIVGFPGEGEEEFLQTVQLVRDVGFVKGFINCYSQRPGTYASQHLPDDIPWEEKKRRWHVLNDIINKQNIGVSKTKDWIRTTQ